MGIIRFDGKEYECKRYTYAELERMLYNRIAVLKDAEMKGGRVLSGVLVDVCDTATKEDTREKYFTHPKEYIFVDFTQIPLVNTFTELV